ncbi:glycoside hydrolase family 128 protein [Xylaria bambusicola]|uniref:glycoside hydrolase family 128 protein n=1 Tax=Xylaria bambusicola TaxID=326684 RepID=UPI00200770A1|nr:glycoside hydrolase family 128 protein [Xylaria bambusicola]KAI0514883.1 glycoside hydrolase family 128 protein [Xylaria bambusicola]
MVIKKRQILWDWSNSSGPGNPGIPEKLDQVPFGDKSPVSSLINWNAWVPQELKGRAIFRPMVRVLESTKGNDWAMIQDSKAPVVLFFNEPERSGITPEQARDIWNKQMLPLRKNKGKKLGSPAVASDEQGRKWIEKFMSLTANDKPDFLCLHYYSHKADDAIKYLEDMHGKWPSLKVMVTEIACIDRNYQNVLQFTVKMCNWMDSKDWVFEYGLFDFQRKVADGFVSPAAQLMDAQGNFTELGKMYVYQQPMKLPGQAIASLVAISNDQAVQDSQATAAADDIEVQMATGDGPIQVTEDDVAKAMEDSKLDADSNEVHAVVAFTAAAVLDADEQKALDAHNNKRKAKGLKPLTWDHQLEKNAETYAKHLAKIGKLEHSSGASRPNQGENLAWYSASNATPLLMGANLWVAEEKNYHDEPIGQGNFASYGHYTQCMWHSTTKIGMASAKDAKGGVYVVGRYSPPGNFTGQKPY